MEAKRLRRPGRAATLENTPSSIWLAWKLVPTASKRVFQKDPKKLPIRTLGSGAFRCRRTRPLAAPTRSFAKDTVMNRGFMTVRAPPHANGGQPMSIAARFGATILILPVTIAPSEAGPCQASIDRVQAQGRCRHRQARRPGPLEAGEPRRASRLSTDPAIDRSRRRRRRRTACAARPQCARWRPGCRCLRQPCALQRRAQQGDARATVTLNWRDRRTYPRNWRRGRDSNPR